MIARGDIRWFRFGAPDKRRPVLVLGNATVIGCAGHRVATDVLDTLILDHVAKAVCAGERLASLRRMLASNPQTIEIARLEPDELRRTWCSLIAGSTEVARAYLVHLLERVVVFDHWVEIVPRLVPQPSACAEVHLGP